MRLENILQDLFGERPLERHTVLQYRKSNQCFGEFLGHPATTEDLVESRINAWLASLTKISTTTVHNRKRGMTAIWNYAAERGLVRYYDQRRLRKTKAAPLVVMARNVADIRTLLEAAQLLKGCMRCGISATDLLIARIRIGFETGLRAGDVLRLTFSQIDGNEIRLVQRKVKRPHKVEISMHTVHAIDVIRFPERELIFPLTKSGLRHWENRLYAKAAELGVNKRRGEALGALRKSFATEVTKRDGIESAARGLGHAPSTGTMVAKLHYVESSAISRPIAPPMVSDSDRN